MRQTSRKLLSATTFLVTAFAFAPAAFAAAGAPSSVDPGVIIRGLDRQERPKANPEAIVTSPAEQNAGKGLSKEKVFKLESVVIEGSTVYGAGDLSGTYKDFAGQQVSFADLNTIAQRVTKKYRDDGYIFSYAVLAPQKVTGGVVHLRAVEGHISSVKLVGNFEDRNGLIKSFADKINTKGAANSKEIERYLLLINDLPGVTARSFIKPSNEKGGGDLIITVEEKPFEGMLGIDNRGSHYLGAGRGTAVGAANNLFGLHDRTTLRAILAMPVDEMQFFDITHEEQIGSEGAKLIGRAAFTQTSPGGDLEPQDIQGHSQTYDLEGQYPLLRSRQYNVSLLAGFNALASDTDIAGLNTAHDEVRTARVGTHLDAADPLAGVTQLDVVGTQGFSTFGANSDGVGRSRANGKHIFKKGTATLTRVQQLPSLFSLSLSGSGQVSSDPLLASEEFAVGGPDYGRAYDSGEMTGDSGYAGSAELRYGGPVDNQYLQSYQAYTFIDYGRVHNKAVVVSEVEDDSLTSLGAGVRFNLVQNWSGYAEWTQPISKRIASENDESSRVFFSVLRRF